MQNKLRTAAVVVAVIVLAIGTWLAYEKYSRRSHVNTMVRDAASRLQIVLESQANPGAAVDLEAQATALEGYESTLKRMNTASFSALADAADDYLVTARELARRSVGIQRNRAASEASLKALADHMRGDRGAAGWIHEAVALKRALDSPMRDYRMDIAAYTKLIDSLPASQATLAALVEGLPLIDETLQKSARAKTLDAYAAAEQNARQVADLSAYAGRRQ